MASNVEICNLALSHLGSGKEISNLETDRSSEALVCRRFFDITVDLVFRGFDWPFATRFVSLGLVETDPTEEWGFSYRYPTDCRRFIRIPSGVRNDSRESRTPYKIMSDSQGRLILTDKEDAQAEYIALLTDPQQWPNDFSMAVSFLLAVYIAPRVTGGDPFGMAKRAEALAEYQRSTAMANSANEQQDDPIPQSEFIRDRE